MTGPSSLKNLAFACDFAMPLAMGMNLGMNVRHDTDWVTASLDSDGLTTAIVIQCPLSRVEFKPWGTRTMLWVGDASVVVTAEEAERISAFLAPPVDGGMR